MEKNNNEKNHENVGGYKPIEPVKTFSMETENKNEKKEEKENE